MAYYRRRNKMKKETTAQALARYKRQQEKQRRQREARQAYERAALAPGGSKNPMTPKWCSFDTYKQIRLHTQQVRYRGTTIWMAYKAGTEPKEWIHRGSRDFKKGIPRDSKKHPQTEQ